MSFDPSTIDWSDPIEANRQLKLQLAALEAQQGMPITTNFNNEPQTQNYDDVNNNRYEDIDDEHDQYVSRADYDPKYDDEYYPPENEPSAEALRASEQYNQGHRDYYEEPRHQQPQKRSTSRTKLSVPKKNKFKNEGQIKRNKRRDNMTFSSTKCRDIDRGNIALLSKLSSIHNNGGGGVPKRRSGIVKKKTGSYGINMKKKQNQIAEENRKFALRLQRVRGTGSLSKKALNKHARRTAKFAELGREVKPVLSKRQKARRDKEIRENRESGWQ
jgi:hypothetical protein